MVLRIVPDEWPSPISSSIARTPLALPNLDALRWPTLSLHQDLPPVAVPGACQRRRGAVWSEPPYSAPRDPASILSACHLECLSLDTANIITGDVEKVANGSQGGWLPAFQPEPQPQDAALGVG